MDLDLRLLRSFLVVAEELHFTRAAARLRVAQPALSQQVRRLEDELGVQLLERTSRRVALTLAGQTLADDGRELLDRAAAVRDRTQRLGRAEAGTVRVAVTAATPRGVIAPLVGAVERRLPELSVELRCVDWDDQVTCLTAGQADVAFVRLPVNDRDLDLEHVLTEPRVAGLARSHPLAGRRQLSIRELRDEPVTDTATQRDYWTVNPRPDGTSPRWGPVADSVEEMLEHVAVGRAICITAASIAAGHARSDVAFVPVTDLAPSEVALARLSHPHVPSTEAFVEVLRAVRGSLGAPIGSARES